METRRPEGTPASRWERRVHLARLVRLAAWLTPVGASSATVAVLSRLVHRPAGLWPAVGWWVGLLALSTAVLIGTERIARRLLPLAALLRLSLAFPDAAPSRFGVVLRNGNGRRIERPGRAPADRLTTGAAADLLARRRPVAPAPATTPAEATAQLAGLVAALHQHDRRTRGHSERVRAYAVLIGQELRLAPDELDRLQWAALLHDIGKTTVPPEILNKPGGLTEDEFQIIKGHPAAGAALIEPLRWWLGEWADAVGQHHEKYDGGGYPLHLGGTSISYAGRIVAVADAYDVMTAARSYKKPLDSVVARTELTRCAGTHFDPVVVRAFLSVSLGRVQRASGPLGWLANLPILGSAPLANAAAAVATAAAPGAATIAAATVAAVTLSSTTAPGEPMASQALAPTTMPVLEVPAPTEAATAAEQSPTSAAPTATASVPTASTGPADVVVPTEQSTTATGAPLDGQTVDQPPATTASTAPPATTTTTTVPYRPAGDVVIPLDIPLGTYSVPRAGFRNLELLAMSNATTLLYGACDQGSFEFTGAGDPVTIRPQGAAAAYTCEFQADRADGTTVRGSFTIEPT